MSTDRISEGFHDAVLYCTLRVKESPHAVGEERIYRGTVPVWWYWSGELKPGVVKVVEVVNVFGVVAV